ncbi:MAG: hypothetical protein QOH84_5749 [Kribbellaceae bacterium]|jgi:hypothetical protein|nr:hypothetical protein [Kribbellaceae bacterium]
MRKAGLRGALVVALAGATMSTGLYASAQPDPPSADDCPNGYQVAFANSSYAGGGSGPGKPGPGGTGTGTARKVNEMRGVGCYGRTGATTGRITLKWSAPGKLYEGIIYYQLMDCSTHKYPVTQSLQYPNGTKSNYGSGAANVSLVRGHKYLLRITGSGEFARSVDGAGAIGYYRTVKVGDTPAWLDFSSSCM